MHKGRFDTIGLRWVIALDNKMRLLKAVQIGLMSLREKYVYFELGFNFLDWGIPLGFTLWEGDPEYLGHIALELRVLFFFLTFSWGDSLREEGNKHEDRTTEFN